MAKREKTTLKSELRGEKKPEKLWGKKWGTECSRAGKDSNLFNIKSMCQRKKAIRQKKGAWERGENKRD